MAITSHNAAIRNQTEERRIGRSISFSKTVRAASDSDKLESLALLLIAPRQHIS